MSEGVQIDQIDRLKPGDVLVFDVPEAFGDLPEDCCLTNGKSYSVHRDEAGNAWIACECAGGGLRLGLLGLEAVGLLRFFRLKTPETTALDRFMAPSQVASDTDWDGTDGLGDEPPARSIAFAEIGYLSIAVLAGGGLLYRYPDEDWRPAKMLDRYPPETPCGAQAMSDETPILTERAECLETPFALERAKSLEAPTSVERDILSETPILLDRDMQFEPTITGERDLPQEQTKLLDRAMLPEQPKQHEPLDFLALNKEFSSK